MKVQKMKKSILILAAIMLIAPLFISANAYAGGWIYCDYQYELMNGEEFEPIPGHTYKQPNAYRFLRNLTDSYNCDKFLPPSDIADACLYGSWSQSCGNIVQNGNYCFAYDCQVGPIEP